MRDFEEEANPITPPTTSLARMITVLREELSSKTAPPVGL